MGAEAQWYQQQLAQIALTAGRKKRSLPVPGTIPGLVPGSPAEAQWYQAQLVHQQQLIAGGRKKRSLPVPGTTCSNCPSRWKKEEKCSSWHQSASIRNNSRT